MKDLFAMLCIRFAKRNTPVRKKNFLKWMMENCKQMKVKHKVDEKTEKRMTSTNLICGDLKHADVVFVAGYDTPSKVYIPGYQYYPFDEKKDHKMEMLSLVIQLLMSFIVLIALFFLIRGWSDYNIWLKIGCVIGSAVLLVAAYLFGKGAANKYNFNKNNAALSVAMTLLTQSVDKKYENVAFVFTDFSSASFMGYRQLSQMREISNKNIVILDCIASEGELFAAYNNGGKECAMSLKQIDGDIQTLDYTDAAGVFGLFRKLTYVTSGKKVDDRQVAVAHTRSRKDSKADFDRIEKVYQFLLAYMDQLGTAPKK